MANACLLDPVGLKKASIFEALSLLQARPHMEGSPMFAGVQSPINLSYSIAQTPLSPAALSITSDSPTSSYTASSVTTTVVPRFSAPPDQWTPDRPDPYVCEYLGQNGCWSPSEFGDGPPYTGPMDGWPARKILCEIPATGDLNGDDTPAILEAFTKCKADGLMIFANTTYYINTVMNTTGLMDVDIEVLGTLLWSTDIQYWLANSLPIGFQNQSSAWHLGGENIHFFGHGFGTLNGNGQAWYDFNNGQSNLHGRPHAITITDTRNSVVEGLRFVKSQMWTLTVARSEKVLLQDIYVNNTSDSPSSNVDSDGCDTVYANNITCLRWTVENGDDAISMKHNSIFIANCTFYNGEGLAMGTVGQYPGQIGVIEDVTATDIRFVNSGHAGRVRTWTGVNKGFPPNGGGGGVGHARNITFTNFRLEGVRTAAWALQQCISYSGESGDCDTSQFQISDMYWGNTSGTLRTNSVALLQCSGAAPCSGVNLFDNILTVLGNDTAAAEYVCGNVVNPVGFDCTGPCDGNAHCASN